VNWRNAVYKRLDNKHDTAALQQKHGDVPSKALIMFESFHVTFGAVAPYLHACLHTHEYLQGRELADRTGETLEHLNKLMKQLITLTSRRMTLKNDPKHQESLKKDKADRRGAHRQCRLWVCFHRA